MAVKENDRELHGEKDQLTKNVPYRMLSPFMHEVKGNDRIWDQKKRLIAYIEQLNKKECIPYQITDGAGLKKHVVINEEWQDFFMDNFVTISGWIEVKKVRYLQGRNPGACNAALATDAFTAQALMRRCNVRAVCTTDDPVDSLEYHRELAAGDFAVRVLPTWRPDRALAVADAADYNGYLARLEEASDVSIGSYAQLLDALRRRHDCFAAAGCRLSDHGMDTFPTDDYTENDLRRIFDKVRGGSTLHPQEVAQLQGGLLFELAVMDSEKGWTQQFHIGPIRNPNTRMFRRLGPDTGYDAIGDKPCAEAGHRFFDRLESRGALAKTILYNLNPKDFEVLAAMAYSFNDGSVPGKMQLGSAWWFLDQERGMRHQIDTLSAFGLLGRFVGMLTDSRSFLSYPRHEYFRRILCDVIGADIESGRLPRSETAFIGQLVEDICYGNAERYFGFFENDDKRQ